MDVTIQVKGVGDPALINQIVTYVKAHWSTILPILLLVMSEYLSMHPKTKSKGTIQLAFNILKRLTGRK